MTEVSKRPGLFQPGQKTELRQMNELRQEMNSLGRMLEQVFPDIAAYVEESVAAEKVQGIGVK